MVLKPQYYFFVFFFITETSVFFKSEINKLSKSNVLLIGDSIIDEYIFSEVSDTVLRVSKQLFESLV